jgi:hypothetical protein
MGYGKNNELRDLLLGSEFDFAEVGELRQAGPGCHRHSGPSSVPRS